MNKYEQITKQSQPTGETRLLMPYFLNYLNGVGIKALVYHEKALTLSTFSNKTIQVSALNE